MRSKPLLIGAALAALALPAAALAQPAKPHHARATAAAAWPVLYKTAQVDGIKIFYREAGDPSKPTILLLHGFPTSSHMYRDLMVRLAPHFHLVAPDYPGSGWSEAPPAAKFEPTFPSLARVMADFTQAVGLKKFIVYMQDFGGPVGFRIAVDHPDWINGFIVQNANAYVEGIAPDQLQGMKDRAGGIKTAEQEQQIEGLIGPMLTGILYQTGVRNFAAVDADSYNTDNLILAQPEQHRIGKALIIDYYDNVGQYPRWQAYLRQHQPRMLIVWGKNDPVFLPSGAEAYKKDLPKAELHFYNTGHFALEEDAPAIADQIVRFYAK